MLRLILMRHCKSSWDSEAPTDFLRPLNKRGRRDAPRVAQALRRRDWAPQGVVVSGATRTVETWERMSRELPEVEVLVDQSLYHAGLSALIASSTRWPDSWQTVLALGHNPGWQGALAALSGVEVEVTTGNAALLSADAGSWGDALRGRWSLEAFLQPRTL